MGRFLVVTSILALVALCHGFNHQPRIVNGIECDPSEFPFYVLVDGKLKCGGSLISDRWVLTAAHCVSIDGRIDRIKEIEVFLGFSSYTNFAQNITVEPKDQHMHPGFLTTHFGFDIALVKLPESVKLGPSVQIAKLPANCPSEHEEGNESVIAVGTGRYTVDAPTPRLLRYAASQTISREKCARLFQANYFRGVDQSNLICAKVFEKRSTYKGDSGGPLIREKDGTLIGVINSGIADQEITGVDDIYVQVNADIRYYFDWISETTGLDMPKC